MARKPIRGSATKQDTGKSCPFCRFPIKERDEVVACGECHSTHHEDCWEENGGCAVPSCAGAPVEEGPGAGSGGSHVPPVAGPSKKKVTLDPRPAIRRRKRQRTRRSDPAAKQGVAASPPGSSSKATLWIVGATVAFLAVIGVIMIANNFGETKAEDEKTCEQGTGVDGIPCYDNGALPNISRADMNSQVAGFMRNWFRDINLGEYYYAWNRISPRVRKQIDQEIGYQEWMNRQEGISRYLEPQSLKVDFAQPGFPDEGVLSVRLSPMPFTQPDDRCGYRGGVTWVKWDPKSAKWYHEPGAKVTDERKRAWGYRGSELFTYKCR
ncbi:MAG TPA: RING finger protein [Solirubrobacterales bacterium]|nr:RING finger protein [Solirubrobacterales bacterium]